MTLFSDYKSGVKQGVLLDESVCSSPSRRLFKRKRDEFYYGVEDSPFFSDKAAHLQALDVDKDLLPFAHYTAIDDDAGEGKQLDSDCFSWSTRSMLDSSRIAENIYNDSSKLYIESSATCLIYGSRGHCGQGMTVYDVVRGLDNGILLEKEYEIKTSERGNRKRYDFTSYPNYYRLGVKNWCRGGPPEGLVRETRKYSIPHYAIAGSMEEVDANLAAGRTWSCGSSIGVSSQRDEYGVSKLKGSWAHAMWICGKLWNDWVKQIFKQPLYIWDNSWGKWNKGVDPQWAQDLGIRLPEGFFILLKDDTWRAVRSKQCITCSNITGFPDLKLSNFGFTGRI